MTHYEKICRDKEYCKDFIYRQVLTHVSATCTMSAPEIVYRMAIDRNKTLRALEIKLDTPIDQNSEDILTEKLKRDLEEALNEFCIPKR
jgi:hypothetical protein